VFGRRCLPRVVACLVGIFCRSRSDQQIGFCTFPQVRAVHYSLTGVDNFTSIGLFYLLLRSTRSFLSLDSNGRKVAVKDAGWGGGAGLASVLQLHVCVSILRADQVIGVGGGTRKPMARINASPFRYCSGATLIHGKFLLVPASAWASVCWRPGYPF